MDLRERLGEEITRAIRELRLEAVRPRPEEVVFSFRVERPVLDGKSLLLPADIPHGWIKYALRQAAFMVLLPETGVPQVEDLGWVYSEAPRKVWLRYRVKPEGPFQDYDPISLFSQLNSRQDVIKALRTSVLVIRCAAKRRGLSFPMLMSLVNRIVIPRIRLCETAKKIMEILSRNPRANLEDFKGAGLSPSSVSRYMKRLRSLGYLFGPENVNTFKLGLKTVLVSFPNVKKFRDALIGFPYTYSILIPISSEVKAHAYLVFPAEGLDDLEELRDRGMEFSTVEQTFQRLNLEPREDVVERVSEAFLTSCSSGRRAYFTENLPEVRITREDIRILNCVMECGRVSASFLSKRGIRSAKQRLFRLREYGYIVRVYLLGFPFGVDKAMIKVMRGLEEMERLGEALGCVASTIVHYVRGDFEGCVALSVVREEIRGKLYKMMKVLYGDDLLIAEDILDIQPGWRLPEHLWNEEMQSFEWEEPLEILKRSIS